VREALKRVHKRLGDLGWDIVNERLEQDNPKTLEELGKRFGVSRERVRQVEMRTRSFLARYLSAFAA
jgi:RNA polymerase primary sigma factor